MDGFAVFSFFHQISKISQKFIGPKSDLNTLVFGSPDRLANFLGQVGFRKILGINISLKAGLDIFCHICRAPHPLAACGLQVTDNGLSIRILNSFLVYLMVLKEDKGVKLDKEGSFLFGQFF